MQKEGGGLVPRIQWLCALVKSLPSPQRSSASSTDKLQGSFKAGCK